MVSSINEWLDTIKWHDAERPEFFARLAERHASNVRAEPSSRRQIEFAVNAAQKSSERRLRKQDKEPAVKPIDDFVIQVDILELGVWAEFFNDNGTVSKLQVAWISPRCSYFIFADRQGKNSLSVTAAALAQSFRNSSARILPPLPSIEKILADAVDKLDMQ